MRAIFLAALLACGCSLKTIALGSVADAMSSTGNGFARDDDPELVRDALPVLIKTMEQIHDALPKHQGLTTALVRACTSYGVAFIQFPAEKEEDKDVAAARIQFARAKRLFLRGRGYGLDGLEQAVPGLRAA